MNSIDFNQDLAHAKSSLAIGEGTSRTAIGRRDAPLLTQALAIVLRRKWELAACIVGALVVGLVITFLMTPQYTASATIEIKREDKSFANVDQTQAPSGGIDQEYYETQYGLLRSASLAQRVASDLKLQNDSHFFEVMKVKPAALWFENGRLKPGAPSQAERVRVAGAVLMRSFKVAPVRLSSLAELSYTSPEPALSKRVVDMWSNDFIQVTLERRFNTTVYARNFLEKRLVQLRSRIDESERKLVDYAAREGIVNLPGAAGVAGQPGAPERSLIVDDLSALNQELTQATADRVKAQSRLGSGGGVSTEALENSAISSLRGKRAELAGDYAKLMVQFEPGYPAAKALQSQIAGIDQAIAREERRVGSTLQETYRAATDRERQLRQQVAQLQTGVLDLRRRSIQYNIYSRDVDTNRQLYDALLQRYKAIGVAGGVGVNNIAVVDPADLPVVPSSPRLVLNILAALAVGLILGAAVLVVLEQMDQGISDPSMVEPLLGAPLLGTIPLVLAKTAQQALMDRKSPLGEAYLSLRTTLNFATPQGAPRTLAVTSSRPSEGKTTTSHALAQSFARPGQRVALVDADMRSPSIHHVMDMPNSEGLSNYLSGNAELASILRATDIEDLLVITAGPTPPSSPELLSGDRFERLIAELLVDFQYVIFDIPPVMGLADAPIVASRVEGTIFVVESRKTHRNLAQVAMERLLSANAALVGIVLTKFDARRAHSGYGYGYGYSYEYGEKK